METNEEVITHVKNTGRGKEVFLPGAVVALSYQPSPKRKTDYDLIAVKKGSFWINIDSQVPNTLVNEALKNGQIVLPGLVGTIQTVKREQRFAHSKFDFLVETDADEQAFVEVKGMTLENKGIGAFPDAPTLRGLKHVTELMAATKAGYRCYILFVVQFEEIKQATIHQEMQPAFAENVGARTIFQQNVRQPFLITSIKIIQAIDQGVQVLAYNCHVTPATIELKSQVTFDLLQAFDDPNK